MIRARMLALLLGLTFVAGTALADAEAEKGDASLPSDISGLKMDIVTLNREISQLENQLLFPSSEASILLSIDVGSSVRLVDINLSLDDKNVGYHFYSEAETAALAKGGVQRVYSGNIGSGQHTLKAAINGYDAQGKAFQRTVSYNFTKGPTRKVVEIKAGDDSTRTQSQFRFKEWESQ